MKKYLIGALLVATIGFLWVIAVAAPSVVRQNFIEAREYFELAQVGGATRVEKICGDSLSCLEVALAALERRAVCADFFAIYVARGEPLGDTFRLFRISGLCKKLARGFLEYLEKRERDLPVKKPDARSVASG